MYGLTYSADVRARNGYEVAFHVAREADLEEHKNRLRLFIRSLCGVVMVRLAIGTVVAPICQRCWASRKSGAV